MLHFSFSTILMAVIATNLLAILLTLCFRHTKIMINLGYKLLAFFIAFTVLRSLLPFELPSSVSIYWPGFISSTIWQLFIPRFEIASHFFSIWTILKSIWVLGIAVNLLRYCLSYARARHYITLHAKVITSKEPFAGLVAKICGEYNKANKFTLIELPGIEAPVLCGIFRPQILIPEEMELSEENWYYVLRHEASHHFHHDILMKTIVRLITMIYWWNPFCVVLNRQTDVILEMRVDDSLTLSDCGSTGKYMRCLIDVSAHVAKTKVIPKSFTMSLLPAEVSDMEKRFRMLAANREKKKSFLNCPLFMTAVTVYIVSYVFIVEAYDIPVEFDAETNAYKKIIVSAQVDTSTAPTEDNTLEIQAGDVTYAIQNDDGTYDTYYNGTYLETTDSLEYYFGITVYTEENCPY